MADLATSFPFPRPGPPARYLPAAAALRPQLNAPSGIRPRPWPPRRASPRGPRGDSGSGSRRRRVGVAAASGGARGSAAWPRSALFLGGGARPRGQALRPGDDARGRVAALAVPGRGGDSGSQPNLAGSEAGWGEAGSADSPGSAVAVARQRPRQSARGRGRVRRALRGGRAAAAVRLPPPSRLRATDGAAGGMTGNSWARAAESKYEHRRRAREDRGARRPRTGPAARSAAAANSRLQRRLHRPGAPALAGTALPRVGAQDRASRSLHLRPLPGQDAREPRACGRTCRGGDGIKVLACAKDSGAS